MGGGTNVTGLGPGVQGHREAGIAQLCEGLDAYRATGGEVDRPYCLALLAEAYRNAGQAEAGLRVLTEGLAAFTQTSGTTRWQSCIGSRASC